MADETKPCPGLWVRACSIFALLLGTAAVLLVVVPFAIAPFFAVFGSPLALIGSLFGAPAAAAGGFAWRRLRKAPAPRSYWLACRAGFWLGLVAFLYGFCLVIYFGIRIVWALFFGPPI